MRNRASWLLMLAAFVPKFCVPAKVNRKLLAAAALPRPDAETILTENAVLLGRKGHQRQQMHRLPVGGRELGLVETRIEVLLGPRCEEPLQCRQTQHRGGLTRDDPELPALAQVGQQGPGRVDARRGCWPDKGNDQEEADREATGRGEQGAEYHGPEATPGGRFPTAAASIW